MHLLFSFLSIKEDRYGLHACLLDPIGLVLMRDFVVISRMVDILMNSVEISLISDNKVTKVVDKTSEPDNIT
jgi:hypothetical protein